MAWQNEQEALAIAEQTEAELNQLRVEFEQRLEELSSRQAKLSTEQQEVLFSFRRRPLMKSTLMSSILAS